MANDNDEAELKLLGRALANLRDRKGLTQAEAGAAVAPSGDQDTEGLTSQGWGKYEAGQRNGLFKPTVQRRLTKALGATPEELMREFRKLAGDDVLTPPQEWDRDVRDEAPMLPILDSIQAGNWLELDAWIQVAEAPRYPIARDPRYRHAQQWLRPVLGDSMNKRGILQGDLVHCISFEDSGRTPATGDIVEVQRYRFSDAEREITLKQVEVTPRGLILWPQSTNERFQTPVDLRDGAKRDEKMRVEITAFIVSAIKRF